MADDVIKNPLRATPKTQVPYEPEHARKGLVVQEAPVNTMGSAVFSSSKKRDLNPPMAQEMFVGVDGDNLDEEGENIPFENGHVIDNNDYVNLGYDSTPTAAAVEPEPLEDNVAAPQVGDYILMVLGKLVTSGPIEKIQSRVKNIMYGEDAAFSSLEISMDDIVVLKRVNIKVGIFIDG